MSYAPAIVLCSYTHLQHCYSLSAIHERTLYTIALADLFNVQHTKFPNIHTKCCIWQTGGKKTNIVLLLPTDV